MKLSVVGLLAASTLMQPALANSSVVAPDESVNVAQLRWLDNADADNLVQADIKKGIYHFYVVCGMTCEPLPFDKVDSLECYPSAKYYRMEGTSDTYTTEDEKQYQEKARLFAIQYNS